MSGLEKLIDRIEEKAERERKSILDEAEEKAEQKKKEMEEKAEKREEEIIEEGREDAEMIKRRRVAAAKRDSRQKVLNVREEIIQEVMAEAEERLSELHDEDRYEEILKDLIIEGCEAVGGGDLEVLISEEDEEIISDDELSDISGELSEDTSLELVTGLEESSGGVLVRKEDGSVSCDNTFEARLDRMRADIRREVAGILFERGD